MLRRVIYAALERRLNSAYRDRLSARGTTPNGVFWRNQSTQIARFDALLAIVTKLSPVKNPSIADIGCGYGAMLDFIEKTPRYQGMRYQGIDINQAMIAACKQQFPNQTKLFLVGKHPRSQVDFCLYSGTFNLCHTADPDLWEDYIFTNLQKAWQSSRYGFVLNLLCAPKTQIKNQIFYADRRQFIARATSLFGPTHATSTPHVNGDVTFVIAKP